MSSVYKKVKKYAKAGTKAVGKRYQVSYGRRGLRMSSKSMTKIAKDVDMIKSRLNVEKKFIDGSITDGKVAQADFNSPGYYTSTITPILSQGVGENQRVGGSVKLTGLHMRLQVQGQADCFQARRLKACIVSSTDSSVTNVVNDLWDPNPLTGYVDYYSNRNYSNNPRAHKIIRTVYFRTPQKQIFTTANYTNAGIHKMFGLKLQQLCRFEGSTSTPKDQHWFLIVFADNGNHSSATTSNSGVMTPEAYTGLTLQEYFRWHFVDN